MITDEKTTVFLIDGDPLTHKTVAALTDSMGLLLVPFTTAGGFLEVYDTRRRGCLVVDLRLPDMTGPELFERLANRHKYRPATVMLAAPEDIHAAIAAVRAGVIDFLEKPVEPRQLLEQIQRAVDADRDAYVRYEREKKMDEICRLLSEREKQVLAMLLLGKSNKQIAAELQLSFKTISWHRVTAMRKLGVDSILELVGKNYPDMVAHFQSAPIVKAA